MRLKIPEGTVPAVISLGLISGGVYAANAALEHSDRPTTASCEAYANTIKVRPDTVQALAATVLNDYNNQLLTDDRRSDTTVTVRPTDIGISFPVETRSVALGNYADLSTEPVYASVSFRPLSSVSQTPTKETGCFGILHDVEVKTINGNRATDYSFTTSDVGEWDVSVIDSVNDKITTSHKIKSTQTPGDFQQALGDAQAAVNQALVGDPALSLVTNFLQ